MSETAENAGLKEKFNGAAAPRQIHAEEYRQLLEKLLREGKGYGKTKPIAGYKLRNIQLVTEKLTAEIKAAAKAGQEQEIVIPDLYVVMDLKIWPNEYIRMLGMEDIASKWARRVVEEGDINKPDFKGPGLWTNKNSNFEFDYIRSERTEENGKRSNLYDPNPAAYRIALPITSAVTIPATWGNYLIGKGGTLTVRERDVPALAAALQSIRDGKCSALDALYTWDKDGKRVARFDVYGMEPGFLEDNYNPVTLYDSTLDTQTWFTAAPPLPPPPVLDDAEPLPLEVEEIMLKYNLEDVPEDGAVFWGRSALTTCNTEDRSIFAANEELVRSYIDTKNLQMGAKRFKHKGKFADLLEILDPYGGCHIQTTGRGDQLLPHMAADVSHFEEQSFWRRMAVRFTKAARGTIHVAASGALSDSLFRMFEYPAIMANDKITHVEVITGAPREFRNFSYVDGRTGEFFREVPYAQYSAAEKEAKDDIHCILYDMCHDENLQTMTKAEWSEWQKQDWFNHALTTLVHHLEDRPMQNCFKMSDIHFSDSAAGELVVAKAAFIGEVIFSLNEVKRLKACRAKGDPQARTSLQNEMKRLQKSIDIFDKYPEALYFDEPVTDLEKARSWRGPQHVKRVPLLTQKLGNMLLQLDDTMTLESKNRLWGRYKSYNWKSVILDDKDPAAEVNKAQEAKVEGFVRTRLSSLKNDIRCALKAGIPRAKVVPLNAKIPRPGK